MRGRRCGSSKRGLSGHEVIEVHLQVCCQVKVIVRHFEWRSRKRSIPANAQRRFTFPSQTNDLNNARPSSGKRILLNVFILRVHNVLI